MSSNKVTDEYISKESSIFREGGTFTRGWWLTQKQYNLIDKDSSIRASTGGRVSPTNVSDSRDENDIKYNMFGESVYRHKVNSGDYAGLKYGMSVALARRKKTEYIASGVSSIGGQFGVEQKSYKKIQYNEYTGEGRSLYNVANYFESGSRNFSEGLYDTNTKTFRADKVSKYFEDNESLVSAYNSLYKKAAAHKKNGGTMTRLDMKLNVGKDGLGEVQYTLFDENNNQIDKPVVAKINKNNLDAIGKMQAAQWVMTDGSGNGYDTNSAFYKLMSNASVNAQQLDNIMRLGILTNDLASADRSGIILNRMVNI
jgi:hypothetical protein